jgi:hypothetical protein
MVMTIRTTSGSTRNVFTVGGLQFADLASPLDDSFRRVVHFQNAVTFLLTK